MGPVLLTHHAFCLACPKPGFVTLHSRCHLRSPHLSPVSEQLPEASKKLQEQLRPPVPQRFAESWPATVAFSTNEWVRLIQVAVSSVGNAKIWSRTSTLESKRYPKAIGCSCDDLRSYERVSTTRCPSHPCSSPPDCYSCTTHYQRNAFYDLVTSVSGCYMSRWAVNCVTENTRQARAELYQFHDFFDPHLRGRA